MKDKESKLTNIGCLTIIILLIGFYLLIPKPPTAKDFIFENVSTYDAGKNAKVKCFYTDCKNFDLIKSHAFKEGARSTKSLVIFYFNNRKNIPDISKTGFILDQKHHKKAIATYKKYGQNIEEFTIH